jgi:hypothetical protein
MEVGRKGAVHRATDHWVSAGQAHQDKWALAIDRLRQELKGYEHDRLRNLGARIRVNIIRRHWLCSAPRLMAAYLVWVNRGRGKAQRHLLLGVGLSIVWAIIVALLFSNTRAASATISRPCRPAPTRWP